MRPSTQEEIDEYEKRIQDLQGIPLTEDHIQACLNCVRNLYKTGTESDFINFEKHLRKQNGRHFLTFTTSDFSNLTIVENNHVVLKDELFTAIYEKGDYLIYYNSWVGLAGRWGPILICGKTLLRKHHHWDVIS